MARIPRETLADDPYFADLLSKPEPERTREYARRFDKAFRERGKPDQSHDVAERLWKSVPRPAFPSESDPVLMTANVYDVIDSEGRRRLIAVDADGHLMDKYVDEGA